MLMLLLFQRAIGRLLSPPRLLFLYFLAPLLLLWLLCQLFGGLPHAVARFPAPDYLTFIAPALAVAGALPLCIGAGLRVLDDRDAGLLEQLLAAPVSQSALLLDELLAYACSGALVVPVVMVAAHAAGMAPHLRLGGVLALLPPALLLNGLYAAASLALAAAFPRRQLVLRGMGLLLCASVIFSDLLLPSVLLPHWLTTLAHLNPLAYAVHAARAALGPEQSWMLYARDLLVLSCALVVTTAAALALHRRQAALALTPLPT
jgi:ABC-2 type transport system permease protein